MLKEERNAQKVGRLSIQRGRKKGLRGQSIKYKEMSLMHQEMVLLIAAPFNELLHMPIPKSGIFHCSTN